jgi:uncharacterized membrane protein YbhN (UPF0104 family)
LQDATKQDAANASRKKYLSLIARIAVATLAILWVLWGQDWRTLAAVFRSLSPWYFGLSLVVFAAAQVIIAIRWWFLLRAQSVHIGVLAAVRLFYLGLFYNNVMPGAIGGDLLKAWYVTKHTDRRLAGALSVLADRAIGLAGTLLIAIVTYLTFVRGQIAIGGKGAGWLSQYWGAVLWAATAVGAVFAALLVHPAARARLAGIAAKARGKGVALLRGGKGVVVVYCSKPWTLLLALTLTLIAQSIVIAAFWLLGRDLGVEAGLSYYFVVFPVMWVVGAIPISIAGLGVTEAGTVGLFTLLAGTPRNLSTALALCQRFVWVLASLPGGVVHLLGAHLPQEEISIDGQERRN